MIKSRLPLKYTTEVNTYEHNEPCGYFLIYMVVVITFLGIVENCPFDLRLFVHPYHQMIGYESNLYIKSLLLQTILMHIKI